ncbi:hypothetical protein HDU99_005515, partial [Rhizoclosmatium hyalinum]
MMGNQFKVLILAISAAMYAGAASFDWISFDPSDPLCRSDGACPLLKQSNSTKDSLQNPCFSPDGSQVIYTAWRGGYNKAPAGIFAVSTMKADAIPSRLVENGASNVNLPGSCWSRSQQKEIIAFASDLETKVDQIWVLDFGTAKTKRITNGNVSAIEPSLSPNGDIIVFEK